MVSSRFSKIKQFSSIFWKFPGSPGESEHPLAKLGNFTPEKKCINYTKSTKFTSVFSIFSVQVNESENTHLN